MINELIKCNSVNIYKLLLENYRKLGLNEVELVVLMNLFLDNEKGVQVLKFQALSQKMSVTVDESTKALQSLIDKGFLSIDIEYDSLQKAIEKYDLKLTCQKLEKLFEIDIESNKMTSIISILEKEKGYPLSSNELVIVTKWNKYSINEIHQAIMKAKEKNINSIKYIDSILSGQERLDRTVDEDKSKSIINLMKDIKR